MIKVTPGSRGGGGACFEYAESTPHIIRAENSHLVIRRLERKQQNPKSHAAALAIAPFP
jgi:hypothetical protein